MDTPDKAAEIKAAAAALIAFGTALFGWVGWMVGIVAYRDGAGLSYRHVRGTV